ncbi:MAG TPA: flagellar basal body rod protein FlgB [Bacillota bacterium]|nr:flagellar basal body rod protein FlgB [Bacillota bacterium]
MDLFLNPVMVALKKGLDAGSLRQRVIADNIANINTPNFKKSTVVFETLLKKTLGQDSFKLVTSDPRHIGGAPPLDQLRPEVELVERTTMRTDGNNVDIDEEMTSLAANSIMYQATARQLGDRFSLLTYVITGGRR